MKCILLVLAICICYFSSYSRPFYISSSSGNDNRSFAEAQNPSTPWQSIEKLNSVSSQLGAGDVVYFNRGDVFYGSLRIASSGNSSSPIVYTAYGNGAKPVITGFTNLTNWVNTSGSIWETSLPQAGSRVSMVVVDGEAKRVGRYPNAGTANNGYLTIDSYNYNTSIKDDEMPNWANWSGGDVVIRKNRYVLDRNYITNHSGNTLYYNSESGHGATAGFGYFIENHPQTLDQSGEWYYNGSQKKFGLYASSYPGSSVKASTVETLVVIDRQHYLLFEDLSFEGANEQAFWISNAEGIRINNCAIAYSGGTAINAPHDLNRFTLENSSVNYSNNGAFFSNNGYNIIVRNNKITNTGIFAGMGKGDTGGYQAISVNGNNNLIEFNQIENTGYNVISFSGNDLTIKNNYINNFNLVKDDGSAIYSWNNGPSPANNYNRKITGNIILNGVGASEGTSDLVHKFSHGIFLDDNINNVEISNNTVANCALNGLYIHNSRDIVIANNTLYNNQVQIALIHDNVAPNSPVRNNTVTGNIFFSLKPYQIVAEYQTANDDLAQFGTFENNYYCRPADENGIIATLRNNGNWIGEKVDLEGWKAMYGKDGSSVKTPITFPQFTINQTIGSNKFWNGDFNSNIGGLGSYSPANNFYTTFTNNGLDGGSLQTGFSSITNWSKGTIIIGVGNITANKKYVLRFSLRGINENKALDIYLRKSLSPYNEMSERKLVKVTGNRTENEVVFTANESQGDASIGIDVPEQNGTIIFDNIQLFEADVTPVNFEDVIRFYYNGTQSTTNIPLDRSYIDVKNNTYNGSISLGAFNSAVLLSKGGSASAPVEPVTGSTCSGTGSITSEKWVNTGGNSITDIPLNTSPSSTGSLNIFEIPSNTDNSYGTRIRGYLCPPLTGNYTFWVAGDDAAELYLSNSEDPSQKTKIAYNQSWVGVREWNKYASQKSATVFLQVGQKYYIEALHKEGAGGDNLAVAWQLPNGAMEAPIPGNRLLPFQITSVVLQNQAIAFSSIASKTYGDAPFALTATASSNLPVSFRIVSGPATVSGNTVTLTGTGTVVVEASQAGNASYAAAPAVNQSFVVAAAGITPPASSACATGTISREVWRGVGGNNISDIPLTAAASAQEVLTSFETASNSDDSYGSRVRGFICPPLTGNYTFWIAGDDAAELWLSTSENPSQKTRIAYNLSWVGVRDWNKFASQKSATIYLQAGQKYYVEALHKEGGGGDNLAVAWQLPDGTMEAPIQGNRLSPFTTTTTSTVSPCPGNGSITREIWNNVGGNNISSLPLNAQPTSQASLNAFESPENLGDNYGLRVRGFICPPQSGNYTFWISGDDATELYLSTNDNPSNKTKIAYNLSWTSFREWNKFATQKSATISLQAGQKYYIEALHKEGGGGDHLSVSWQLPDGTMEAPIPGNRLSPYEGNASIVNRENGAPIESILMANDNVIKTYPNPARSTATVQVTLAETGNVTVRIYTMQGQLVKQLYNGNVSGGIMQQYLFNVNNLAAGTYFIRVTTKSKTYNNKIVIAK